MDKIYIKSLTLPLHTKLELPDGYTVPHKQSASDTFSTVRETYYQGKYIRVETTHRIIIDNKPVTSHTGVLNDGSVYCHGFPNHSFPSALDLARMLVDNIQQFPEDELNRGGRN